MKKILIIHTGGTFGMSPADPSKTLRPGNLESEIEKHLPALGSIAVIEIQIPFNLDSSNIGPEQWIVMYKIIAGQAEKFDGFVLIHGTDTLVYTAAALSFMLTGFGKPVIITGSQRPLSAIRSDARSNLVNAVELATMQIPEVAICFDNKLYRGNRTKKISIESYRGFESPNYPLLASIGLRIHLHPENFLHAVIPHQLKPKIDPDISVIHLFPGIRTEAYHELLDQPIRSVIIAGFGAGNFPVYGKKWPDFISACIKTGKIVCIASQSPHGRVDPELYETGRQALDAGAVGMRDMTLESAIVKLMILQGNFKARGKIIGILQESLAGEMTIEP
jgi:L-asparaginase